MARDPITNGMHAAWNTARADFYADDSYADDNASYRETRRDARSRRAADRFQTDRKGH